jgi:chemotaxis protein methyltransferase WspC
VRALTDFEGLLKASMGLNVASIGGAALDRAVDQRLAACGLRDAGAYWDRVRGSSEELQELIEAIVVPETWLFRDRESFAALAELAQDELSRRPHATLHLLSLPCSTGEEPYSMAMALLDAAVPAERFHVDAVDISARALAHAERGVYGRNSFRGNALSFRDHHFDATATGFRVRDDVRRQVHFQQGNLFADDFLPGVEIYDVIFCRNVLIYFDRDTQDRAIGVLKRLLRTTGALFVAPAETGLPSSHGFASTNVPLSFAFRRRASERPEPQLPVPLPVWPRQPARAPTPVAAARPPRPAASARAERDEASAPPAAPSSALADATRLADEGHFVEAARCCEDHVRRHGPSAEAFYLLGLVRDATGNPADATSYYRKALYLDPQHYEAQVHLALLVEKQGDAAGAQVLRNRARRLALRRTSAHD